MEAERAEAVPRPGQPPEYRPAWYVEQAGSEVGEAFRLDTAFFPFDFLRANEIARWSRVRGIAIEHTETDFCAAVPEGYWILRDSGGKLRVWRDDKFRMVWRRASGRPWLPPAMRESGRPPGDRDRGPVGKVGHEGAPGPEDESRSQGLVIWGCKIGVADRSVLPEGADSPLRDAVQAAYRELTGRDADFCYSGWGEELTPIEAEDVLSCAQTSREIELAVSMGAGPAKALASSDLQCEQHPGVLWPHDDCIGPGMPFAPTIERAPWLLPDGASVLESMAIYQRGRDRDDEWVQKVAMTAILVGQRSENSFPAEALDRLLRDFGIKPSCPRTWPTQSDVAEFVVMENPSAPTGGNEELIEAAANVLDQYDVPRKQESGALDLATRVALLGDELVHARRQLEEREKEREEARRGEDHWKAQRDAALFLIQWLLPDMIPAHLVTLTVDDEEPRS